MIIEKDVLAALSDVEIAGRHLGLRQHLERGLYLRVQQVLNAAGGRWSHREQAYIFESNPTGLIDQILLTRRLTATRDLDLVSTPASIVSRLIELAGIEPWMLTLDPGAGSGMIARELGRLATVECFEILPDNVAGLRADGSIRTVFAQDFLRAAPAVRYERVVMHPPFSRQADILHVRQALRFLKPDGRLVSLMSAGLLFRRDALTRDFRSLIERSGGSIEPNPSQSFPIAGALIETVNVVIPAGR